MQQQDDLLPWNQESNLQRGILCDWISWSVMWHVTNAFVTARRAHHVWHMRYLPAIRLLLPIGKNWRWMNDDGMGNALTTLESWMQWVNCNDAIAASIGLRSQGATFGHGEPRLWQPSYTLFFPTLPPCFLKLFLMRSFFGLFSHCIDLDLGYMLRWDRPLCLGDCECFQTVSQQAEVTCTSCLGFGSSFEARTDL